VKFFYLFVDLGALAVPLLFSFHPRIKFYREWKSILPALLLPLIVFLPWDVLFTSRKIWGFNNNYITGIRIYNLPIEEVLFFICIPYACLFTYFCISHLWMKKNLVRGPFFMYYVPPVLLLLVGFTYYNYAYTFSTAVLLGISLLLGAFLFKAQLRTFYRVYAVLLLPFFIINGLLTGTGIEHEVVWYNNSENLDIRLLTIPIEDVFYGMLLVILNVYCFEWFRRSRV
jgi:lycopene cyclase domain-containing protein